MTGETLDVAGVPVRVCSFAEPDRINIRVELPFDTAAQLVKSAAQLRKKVRLIPGLGELCQTVERLKDVISRHLAAAKIGTKR